MSELPDREGAEHDKLESIVDIRQQVYPGYIQGLNTSVRFTDRGLLKALEEIAEYYDSTTSWVLRLAAKRFVKYFEEQTKRHVYTPSPIQQKANRSDSEDGYHRKPRGRPPKDRRVGIDGAENSGSHEVGAPQSDSVRGGDSEEPGRGGGTPKERSLEVDNQPHGEDR